MSDDQEEVILSVEGEQCILRRKDAAARETEIVLTIANLLAILPSIQRVCSQKLENRTGPRLSAEGVSAIVPMTATGFDVTGDAFHKDEVFLTLRDGYHNHFSFALSPSDGLKIAKRLAEEIHDLDQQKKPPKTRQ